MLGPGDLHDYQKEGIQFLMERTHGALLAQLGLGKSIMCLSALNELISFGDSERVLIIAPKRVATTVWHTEAANWTHTKHLRVMRAVGSPSERRSAVLSSLAFDHGIVTINPENLDWLVELLAQLKRPWPFDTVVFDEFSMFKRHDSNRFKTMERICCRTHTTRKGVPVVIHPLVKRVYGLTATPATNGLENLWPQVKLLDSGDRLGRTITAFRKEYMRDESPPNSSYQNWEPIATAEERVYEEISDIVKVMRQQDFLDMPEIVHSDLVVDIPASVRKDMEVLEDEFLLELRSNDSAGEEIVSGEVMASNAAVLAGKLMQFCIAEGTEVLCRRGWVAIEDVTSRDEVWDGEEWVSHRGLLHQGLRPVMESHGVLMTEDHEILTTEGWRSGEQGARSDRAPVRIPDGYEAGRRAFQEHEQVSGVGTTVRLRNPGAKAFVPAYGLGETGERAVLWMPKSWKTSGAWDGRQSDVGDVASHEKEVPRPGRQGLEELRGPRDQGVREMGLVFPELPAGYGGETGRYDDRPHRQHGALRTGKLSLGHSKDAVSESSNESCRGRGLRTDVRGGGRHHHGSKPCFDLASCGPRSRFTVRGRSGPLIVHNCSGACYVGDPSEPDYEKMWAPVHDAKLKGLAELDETVDRPMLIAYWFQSDLERIKKKFPKWQVLDKKGSQIAAWNKGKVPRLLLHPASAGHGLNLQYGGDTMVLFSMFWSLELYQQLVGRIHRQGQTEGVSINRIVVRDSIEQRVAAALAYKAGVQDHLFEYLAEHGN